MVNFLSMFCLELQQLLKPICNLTRKGRRFIWGKKQQTAFKEIKPRLVKTPMLHLPNSTGRFHLLEVHGVSKNLDPNIQPESSLSDP